MLFVALAVTAAAFMSSRQYFDIRQTSNIVAIDNAYHVAMAAEAWSISILAEDLKNAETGKIDDYEETTLRAEGKTVPYDNGTISGKILDLQGRFNINNLIKYDTENKKFITDSVQFEIFKRLIKNLNDNKNPDEPNTVEIPPELANKVIDWIDEDINTTMNSTGNGAEDDTYSAMPTPHMTANNKMASTSEILLLDGIWDETNKTAIFNRLEPYIAALPERTAVNLNVASKELVAALVKGVSLDDAETFASDLQNKPAEKPDDIVTKYKDLFPGEDDKQKNIRESIDQLSSDKVFDVMTEYFQFEIQASSEDVTSRLTSVVKRKKDGTIFVLSRGKGSI